MGLGYPWYVSYLQHQQKENSSVRCIYQSIVTHQFSPDINPIGLSAPWDDFYVKQK